MDLKTYFEAGQEHFGLVLRELIYKTHPEVFEQLDFYNNDHFSDPLLFGYFNNLEGMSIEQILEFYLKEKSTPIITDAYGAAFLPHIGYFVTDHKETPVQRDEARFVKPLLLEEHNNIEVCLYSNPYYNFFLEENGATKESPCIRNIPHATLKYVPYIKEAFELIKRFCPQEYAMYTQSTRRIILYENPDIRSFVTRQVHGTIFVSVNSNSNTPFFVEELIHQCSHNVFNAIIADVKEFLKIPPTTPLAKLIGENEKLEIRDIFGAFHGVYTVSTGVNSILPMVLSNTLDETMHFELMGRLAIKKPRFRSGIQRVNFEEVYTEKGAELYHHLDARCFEQMQQYPDIFDVFSFSNQGSVFSYSRFLEQNNPKQLS
ncbi:MAG: hypothetical protein DHS20C18_04890 [Saprospiraceae bacterium]|nr:MAG: hypothetical protein DHS20C18_04890 [Saprospiraceae bacterium]